MPEGCSYDKYGLFEYYEPEGNKHRSFVVDTGISADDLSVLESEIALISQAVTLPILDYTDFADNCDNPEKCSCANCSEGSNHLRKEGTI